MEHFDFKRRGFLKFAGAASALAVGSAGPIMRADEPAPKPKNADEALAILMAGNQRFMAGNSKRVPLTHQELAQFEKGQHPFATILGCSDSRVPVEIVFDQGLGDLFVIRLAGNVVDTDVVGSLEYAVAHLKTKLVVVMGHEGCGAVTAALDAKEDREKEPIGIQKLVEQIEPALVGIDNQLPLEQKLHLAVEANVRQSVKKILQFPKHQEARKKGLFEIVGAVYEIGTGKARLLDI